MGLCALRVDSGQRLKFGARQEFISHLPQRGKMYVFGPLTTLANIAKLDKLRSTNGRQFSAMHSEKSLF